MQAAVPLLAGHDWVLTAAAAVLAASTNPHTDSLYCAPARVYPCLRPCLVRRPCGHDLQPVEAPA